jgi:hypothetical protein
MMGPLRVLRVKLEGAAGAFEAPTLKAPMGAEGAYGR